MNSRVIAFLFCITIGLSLGCTPRRSTGEVRSAMPTQGKIRVLFTRVKEQSDFTHYKWSFVGDRNWSAASCNTASFKLEKSSKLNSPDSRGGCFTWEIDLQSRKSPDSDTWTSKGEIRGSNGKTAKLDVTNSKCDVTRSSDDMVSVGDEIDLGKLGQVPLKVTFSQ
jgi:hypothetical protein